MSELIVDVTDLRGNRGCSASACVIAAAVAMGIQARRIDISVYSAVNLVRRLLFNGAVSRAHETEFARICLAVTGRLVRGCPADDSAWDRIDEEIARNVIEDLRLERCMGKGSAHALYLMRDGYRLSASITAPLTAAENERVTSLMLRTAGSRLMDTSVLVSVFGINGEAAA